MSEANSIDAPKKIVPLVRNTFGQREFRLSLTHGDWRSDRVVTITDETVDVTDLLRRIANNDTSVTSLDCPEGEIHYVEEMREYRVAVFHTEESEDPDDIDVCFFINGPDDQVTEVEGADVNDITVQSVGDEDEAATDASDE